MRAVGKPAAVKFRHAEPAAAPVHVGERDAITDPTPHESQMAAS
jgi:hypothetical protein